jgi:hypothetical protein
MRAILIPSSLAVFALLIVCLAAGPQITLLLDRFYTVPDTAMPVGKYGLNTSEFLIGSRRWFLAKDLTVGPDSHNRLTVAKAGRTFTLGPVTKCYSGPIPHYEFTPDQDDRISFVKSRSWLSWPTPFKFNIMGAPTTTSWRRHSYYRLLWKKSSGATLEVVWRDEQWFYSSQGWTEAYLQIAPVVKITVSPFEDVVVRYMASQNGWKRDQYRLESRGPSPDGKYDVTSVIFLDDEKASHPGAGKSVDVFVDKISAQVSKELGGQ